MTDSQTITRRTVIVLVSLIVAMTLGSGLLLMLEPGPVVMIPVPLAAVQDQQLHVVETGLEFASINVDSDRWSAIVVHDSRSNAGSAASLDQLHRNLGLDSLAYHFVVTNGNGAADGLVQPSVRWQNQVDGAHTLGDSEMAKWYNHKAIGICVIGLGDNNAPTDSQMTSLTDLVRELQQAYDIPAGQIEIRFGGDNHSSSPTRFPTAAFFAQLDR